MSVSEISYSDVWGTSVGSEDMRFGGCDEARVVRALPVAGAVVSHAAEPRRGRVVEEPREVPHASGARAEQPAALDGHAGAVQPAAEEALRRHVVSVAHEGRAPLAEGHVGLEAREDL